MIRWLPLPLAFSKSWPSKCNSSPFNPFDIFLSANVADVVCGGSACAARKTDSSTVLWGHAGKGGSAFAWDHSSYTYGDSANLVDGSGVDLSANVADVVCGGFACAARKTDGSAVAWGDSRNGGDASGVDLAGAAPPPLLPSPPSLSPPHIKQSTLAFGAAQEHRLNCKYEVRPDGTFNMENTGCAFAMAAD